MSDLHDIILHYDRSDARRLLEDTDSDGVVLYCLALHALGIEAVHGDEAEMLEVYLDLENKFGAKLPHETESKLQAVSLLVGTDAFFDTPHGLHSIAVTLTQGEVEVGPDLSIDRASWEEMQWAIFCASLLRAEDEEPSFSMGVLHDMALAISESGTSPEAKAEVAEFMEERKRRMADDFKLLGVPENLLQLEFKRAQK
jgi:hypothetical protein